MRHALLALVASLTFWAVISTATGDPSPDPAPGAKGPAVILPLCPYVPGVPNSYWVTGTDAAGNVFCVGPNLPPSRRYHHKRHHGGTR